MSSSRKTPVIESLFNSRWNSETNALSNPSVTLTQVEAAIVEYNTANPNRTLSTRNPANFFKDFIRKKRSANSNWPPSVLTRGYTARQITGENLCFEFIPLDPDQTEPFPIQIYMPSPDAPKHKVQSASMSLASRRLGRSDEAWLIQVLVKLNVIETHLSLYSAKPIIQVDLLQTNVKQARTEIDALFLAFEASGDDDGLYNEILITCEAKGRRDDILEDQIIAQVTAVFRMTAVTQDEVIPIAVKSVRPSEIHIVQFGSIQRSEAPDLSELSIHREALYELVPQVPGIGA
jgi:hypothetical protein